MLKPTISHEGECGLRVWRVRRLGAMARAHTHPDVELNLLSAGGPARYQLAAAEVAVRPGQLAVFWGGVPHRLLEPDGIASGIWVTVPLPWILRWQLPRNFAGRLLRGEFFRESNPAFDGLLFSRWVDDFDSNDAGCLRVLLLELQARLHRLAADAGCSSDGLPGAPGQGAESRVSRLIAFMAAHYQEPMDTQRIAAAAGLHPRYAMRVFRAHFRMSLWEYLLRLRVSHARTLLLTTDKKILDIALESGFASPAPFYCAFRKYAGCAPGSVRLETA